jgi:hypothetical protein
MELVKAVAATVYYCAHVRLLKATIVYSRRNYKSVKRAIICQLSLTQSFYRF